MPELYSGTTHWCLSCSAIIFVLGFACATPSAIAAEAAKPDIRAQAEKSCDAFDFRLCQTVALREELALIPTDVAADIRRIADWVKLQRVRDEPRDHIRRCAALLELFNHEDFRAAQTTGKIEGPPAAGLVACTRFRDQRVMIRVTVTRLPAKVTCALMPSTSIIRRKLRVMRAVSAEVR
jgi:hypothetical protein